MSGPKPGHQWFATASTWDDSRPVSELAALHSGYVIYGDKAAYERTPSSVGSDAPVISRTSDGAWWATLNGSNVPWLGPFTSMAEAQEMAMQLTLDHPVYAYISETMRRP